MEKKRYNIRDIAKLANVSAGTVSRVLNQKKSNIPITEKTKEKILKVCKDVNYYPNIHAQRLFTNKSNTIALIIPPQTKRESKTHVFSGHSLSEMLSGIEEAVTSMGYKLLLLTGSSKFVSSKEYLRLFADKSIDGMLVWGPRLDTSYVMDLYAEEKNVILLNSHISGLKMNFIVNDEKKGSSLVTKHLIDKGHKNIVYIKGRDSVSISLDRYNAAKLVLKEHGIDDFIAFENGDYSIKSGAKAMHNLLKDYGGRFTAVICANDEMAIGAMKVVKETSKLKIPEDIAFVGGDNIRMSEYISPSLTTFHVDMFQLGIVAVQRLIALINNQNKNYIEELLDVKLVIRDST